MKGIILSLLVFVFASTAIAQPAFPVCEASNEPEARLGCHLAQASPRLQECNQFSEPQARLACYDRLSPPRNSDAELILPARACYKLTNLHDKNACYRKSYEAYVGKKGPARCYHMPDNEEQARCFDDEEIKQSTFDKELPKKWKIVVREKDLPRANKLEEPATVGLARADGKSRGLLKAAISARSPALNSRGLQAFLSATINHDLTVASTRGNSKAVAAGIHGPWTNGKGPIDIDTAAQIKFKEDNEVHTQSRQIIIDNTLVVNKLLRGRAFGPKGGHEILPIIGLMRDDIHKAKPGDPFGTATSAYAAIKFGYWTPLLPRVQFSATAQRFVDLDVASSRTERYVSYYKAAVDWYLYDPNLTTVKFNPIFGLTREYGTDPLVAAAKKNVTSIALRFKFDFP